MIWKKIGSAPKDTLLIICNNNILNSIRVGYFDTERNRWYLKNKHHRTPTPTHWMQLPDPPKEN